MAIFASGLKDGRDPIGLSKAGFAIFFLKRAGGRNQHRCWIKKLRLVSAPDDQPSALVYPPAQIGHPIVETESTLLIGFITKQVTPGSTNWPASDLDKPREALANMRIYITNH